VCTHCNGMGASLVDDVSYTRGFRIDPCPTCNAKSVDPTPDGVEALKDAIWRVAKLNMDVVHSHDCCTIHTQDDCARNICEAVLPLFDDLARDLEAALAAGEEARGYTEDNTGTHYGQCLASLNRVRNQLTDAEAEVERLAGLVESCRVQFENVGYAEKGWCKSWLRRIEK
jgi:hypothetical protein